VWRRKHVGGLQNYGTGLTVSGKDLTLGAASLPDPTVTYLDSGAANWHARVERCEIFCTCVGTRNGAG